MYSLLFLTQSLCREQHHLPNGYYIHTPHLGMEVEVTFLLLRNVVYGPHWDDPHGHAILIRKA